MSWIFRPICWVFGHTPIIKKISAKGMSWDTKICELCHKTLRLNDNDHP